LVFTSAVSHAAFLVTAPNPQNSGVIGGVYGNATLVGTGTQTGQGAIDAAIDLLVPNLSSTEIYKQDVGGGESGVAAAYYTTTVNGDASGATIDWVGPNLYTPLYTLVKDGNQVPAWYLYSISGWNGQTDDLVFSGFWPAQGAISHISLYGPSGSTVVPEPLTAGLMISGLVCSVIAFRKRGRKS
jgi:hypothetical protein